MDALNEFTPAQQQQLVALLAANNAQNAVIQKTTSIPPHGRFIGRVGGFIAFLVNCSLGALAVLLLPADAKQAASEWTPTVIAACEHIEHVAGSLLSQSSSDRHPPGSSTPDMMDFPIPLGSAPPPPPPSYQSVIALSSVSSASSGGNPAYLAGSAVLTLTGRGTLS